MLRLMTFLLMILLPSMAWAVELTCELQPIYQDGTPYWSNCAPIDISQNDINEIDEILVGERCPLAVGLSMETAALSKLVGEKCFAPIAGAQWQGLAAYTYDLRMIYLDGLNPGEGCEYRKFPVFQVTNASATPPKQYTFGVRLLCDVVGP